MYNPSAAGRKGTLFGLPYTVEEADIVLVPVHLDATVSYHDGTAKAPSLILEESTQLDLSLLQIANPWLLKMAMQTKVVKKSQNEIHRGRALNVIEAIEAGKLPDREQIQFVNEFCRGVCQEVERVSSGFLDEHKIVGVVGGDHSSPLGLITALSGRYDDFGVLQVDAHMDLRKAYEGFEYSHASIMYNVLQLEAVQQLTQVGIRDFCEEEETLIAESEGRIKVFFDEELFRRREQGISWSEQCSDIVASLPQNVYISFDMDGLIPSLCPHTGTPVPGGLDFNEAVRLMEEVVHSGRKVIGFDVCETGNHTWDANVASRVLYRLATYTGVSQGLLQFRK